eukprot:365987-Chlamydomonas_euryale.AAC.8
MPQVVSFAASPAAASASASAWDAIAIAAVATRAAAAFADPFAHMCDMCDSLGALVCHCAANVLCGAIASVPCSVLVLPLRSAVQLPRSLVHHKFCLCAARPHIDCCTVRCCLLVGTAAVDLMFTAAGEREVELCQPDERVLSIVLFSSEVRLHTPPTTRAQWLHAAHMPVPRCKHAHAPRARRDSTSRHPHLSRSRA